MRKTNVLSTEDPTDLANVKYRCRHIIRQRAGKNVYCNLPLSEKKMCYDHGNDIGDYRNKK